MNGRTRAGRRFNALVRSFADELGGETLLSEARMATIRQLAGVIIESERQQAAIVAGEIVDTEQVVRIANLQGRLQRQLGLGQTAKPEKLDPHQYLDNMMSGAA